MSIEAVRQAATALVAAFGAHDAEAYFNAFDESATFLFYNFDRLLTSREDYRAVWLDWERDGFHVVGCASTDQSVQMLSEDVAVFTHVVRTTLAEGDGSVVTGERETIVFQLRDGRWVGVHEHLSADPNVAAQ
jgi:ketosteroid isomerase-like protein